MNNQISHIPKGVSIETKKLRLTDGELALLALMKSKIEESDVIVFSEVLDIYKNHVRTDKGYNGEWFADTVQSRAKCWFRRSLGNLILKAKLVVIPVIDI